MNRKLPLLKAEGLEVSFSGVIAASGVNLEINHGEFVAIIGPNGSGKTTFLNLCTGYTKPVAGEVFLEGVPITNKAPRSIARQGIARAFQIPQLFTDQSLIDNLSLAIASRKGVWDGIRPLARSEYRDEALSLLRLFGMERYADTVASALSEGLRKLSDITLAMALKPKLLLLDEPTSGVSSLERFPLMDTLMSALKQKEVTALFVEHDMEVVKSYADRVVVWDSGNIMTQGTPEDVFNDPRVLKNVVGV